MNSADHALRNHVSRLRKCSRRLRAGSRGWLRVLRVTCCASSRASSISSTSNGLRPAGGSRWRRARPARRRSLCAPRERLWQGDRSPIWTWSLRPSGGRATRGARLAAVEERIDAELSFGRQLALVPELEALGAEHPYRERFRAQLMLALYRCGRQAEGLEVYRQTRRSLSDELGLEPGLELQELERAILVHDPALSVAVEEHRRERRAVETSARTRGSRRSRPRTRSSSTGGSGWSPSSSRGSPMHPSCARRGLRQRQVLAAAGGSAPGAGGRAVAPSPRRASGEEFLADLGRVPRGERLVLRSTSSRSCSPQPSAEEERRAFIDALVEAAWDPERRAVILSGCARILRSPRALWRARRPRRPEPRPARADEPGGASPRDRETRRARRLDGRACTRRRARR